MRPVVILVLVMVLGSCARLSAESTSPNPDRCIPNAPRACTTVGGVAVGEFAQSWNVRTPPCRLECREPEKVARAEVELRAPNHPDIVAIDEFGHDLSGLCGSELCVLSGYLGAFVFTFEDSSTLVIEVGCTGISTCQAQQP
jgi:hypothetical protein